MFNHVKSLKLEVEACLLRAATWSVPSSTKVPAVALSKIAGQSSRYVDALSRNLVTNHRRNAGTNNSAFEPLPFYLGKTCADLRPRQDDETPALFPHLPRSDPSVKPCWIRFVKLLEDTGACLHAHPAVQHRTAGEVQTLAVSTPSTTLHASS